MRLLVPAQSINPYCKQASACRCFALPLALCTQQLCAQETTAHLACHIKETLPLHARYLSCSRQILMLNIGRPFNKHTPDIWQCRWTIYSLFMSFSTAVFTLATTFCESDNDVAVITSHGYTPDWNCCAVLVSSGVQWKCCNITGTQDKNGSFGLIGVTNRISSNK